MDALSNRTLITVPALGLLALGFDVPVFVPTLVGATLLGAPTKPPGAVPTPTDD